MTLTVEELIPHRPPFLFVDKIEKLTESYCEATFFADPNLDFFKGHFPDLPIMPGVLQVEAIGQVCSCILSFLLRKEGKNKKFFLASSENVKFPSKVVPGDVLSITATLERSRSGFYRFKGYARHQNGDITTEGLLMLCVEP